MSLSEKILGDLVNCAFSFKQNITELVETIIRNPNFNLSELEINCLPFYGFVS